MIGACSVESAPFTTTCSRHLHARDPLMASTAGAKCPQESMTVQSVRSASVGKRVVASGHHDGPHPPAPGQT